MKESIVGIKYNKITAGPHKGLYEAIFIVNHEGIPMSVWTKEQEAYLDKRFIPLERDVKGLKKDMTSVKEDIGKILNILSRK